MNSVLQKLCLIALATLPALPAFAQESDTARVIALDEVVVTGDTRDDPGSQGTREEVGVLAGGALHTMGNNDPLNASVTPGLLRVVPQIAEGLSLHNLDYRQFGSFVDNGVELHENFTIAQGFVSQFNPHLVRDIRFQRGVNAAERDAPAGTADILYVRPPTDRLSARAEADLLSATLTVHTPISVLGGFTSVSLRRLDALPVLKRSIPDLDKIFPEVYAVQAHTELDDGRAQASYSMIRERKDFQEDLVLKQTGVRDYFTFRYGPPVDPGHHRLEILGGYEYSGLETALHQEGTTAIPETETGTSHYTLGVRLRQAEGRYTIGADMYRMNSRYLDEGKLGAPSADDIFRSMMNALAGRLSPDQRADIEDRYYAIPPEDRYERLRAVVGIFTTYETTIRLLDPDLAVTVAGLATRLHGPALTGDYTSVKSITTYDVWARGNVIAGNLLIEPGTRVTLYKSQSQVSYGLSATWFGEGWNINAGWARVANFKSRNINVVGGVFPETGETRPNIALQTSVSADYTALDDLHLGVTLYRTSIQGDFRGNYYDDISVRGVDLSFRHTSTFSQTLTGSWSKATVDHHWIPGAVSTSVALDLGYAVGDNLGLFAQAALQEGPFTNRNPSGEYRPLGTSLYVSVGGEFGFSIIKRKENDLTVSFGVYNILSAFGRRNTVSSIPNADDTFRTVSSPLWPMVGAHFTY